VTRAQKEALLHLAETKHGQDNKQLPVVFGRLTDQNQELILRA
jgi:hypothetical protein